MCPRCNSLDWNTVAASGRGELYSFVQPQHPPPCRGSSPATSWPSSSSREGTRLVSNLIDVDPAGAEIGMAVDVVFETFDDGPVLPLFRPAAEGGLRMTRPPTQTPPSRTWPPATSCPAW